MFGTIAPVAEYPDDVFEPVMRVNVFGVFLVVKHALRVMQRGGSVIINSSVVGLMSDARISGYATSKHALVGLMRTAAKEMAPAGIRVNTIHPGPTANAFQTAIEVEAVGASAEESAAAFLADDPAGATRDTGRDREGRGVPRERRERVHDGRDRRGRRRRERSEITARRADTTTRKRAEGWQRHLSSSSSS